MKRQLIAADILSMEDYARIRDQKRAMVIETKRNRRVSVGPYATFYFESYDTMWLQVHEMLRIEKGGMDQLSDELQAYNPMIPNGQELTATVMFEIVDPTQRAALLSKLGGVEHSFELRLAGYKIKGQAEEDLDYTSGEGKASSVQFVHFNFAPHQITKFRELDTEVVLAITHPSYGHMAVLPQATKEELAKVFNA